MQKRGQAVLPNPSVRTSEHPLAIAGLSLDQETARVTAEVTWKSAENATMSATLPWTW
jgi:hypothetical protein